MECFHGHKVEGDLGLYSLFFLQYLFSIDYCVAMAVARSVVSFISLRKLFAIYKSNVLLKFASILYFKLFLLLHFVITEYECQLFELESVT